jgi:tetratricopeptide (TPR) repeat protein
VGGADTARVWLRYAWLLVPLVLGGALIVLVFPHLASAYHLEAGGRALDDPPEALEHLGRAIEWQPANAQAYRLLGRAYRLHGNWPAAVEALERFVAMRPDNPLGHIELAETYESILAEMAAMYAADLVTKLPEAERGGQAALAEGVYALSEPGVSSSIAEETTVVMTVPSILTYTLSLPSQPSVLRFGINEDTQEFPQSVDLATVEVLVNGEQIFSGRAGESATPGAWSEKAVDLATWRGQEVRLTLITRPSPEGGATGDQVGWFMPQVIDARLAALQTLEPESNLVAEWRAAGLTARDFLARGEISRETRRFEEAMSWYQRALDLEPGSGDAWYYIGRLAADQNRWQEALQEYERALALDQFREAGVSSVYYRLGLIYHRNVEPRQLEAARQAYEDALAAEDFDSKEDEAWAHARLGQITFGLSGDAARAESEISRALELSPRDKWLHIVLGDLYREIGRRADAAAQYERALQIDPSLDAAQNRLDALK